MTHFAIGTVVYEKLGEMRIYFNGPNQEITLEKYSHDKGRQWGKTGIVPKSLLNAIEILEKVKANCNYSKYYSNLKLYEFDRDELRAEEERIEKLRVESKRRVMDMGAPTVSELIKTLENIVAVDSDLMDYPVYFGGTEWYLHIDKGDRCVILDEEMLYEDYELDT